MTTIVVIPENKFIRVKTSQPAIIRILSGGGTDGATTFTQLTDTPGVITSGFLVVGNIAGTALEFLDPDSLQSNPGGSSGQVQFNNAGGFDGLAQFTWDGMNFHLLTNPGTIFTAGSPSINDPFIALDGGSNSGMFLTQSMNTDVGFCIEGIPTIQSSRAGPGVARNFISGFSISTSGIQDQIQLRLLGTGIGFEVGITTGLLVVTDSSHPFTLQSLDTNPRLRFAAASLGGSVDFIGPDIAAEVVFTLPGIDGTTRQVLSTNGAGTLSFISLASEDLSDVPSLGTPGQILQVNAGATALEYTDPLSVVPNRTINFSIDNGSAVIPVSTIADLRIFGAGTIRTASVLADQPTNITVVFEWTPFTNPLGLFASIATVALASQQTVQVGGLAAAIPAGSVIRMRVLVASSVATRITGSLEFELP